MKKLRGDILPLALIMTSMVLLASVGIGTVVLEGLQRSKDTDQSVGAYYMADSGVERQLYEIRKNNQTYTYVNTLSANLATTPVNQSWKSVGALGTNATKVIPLVDVTSFAVVDLFDPDQLTKPPMIDTVTIDWSKATTCGAFQQSTLEASYGSWNIPLFGVPTWTDNYVVLSKDSSGHLVINSLNPNSDYRLRLRFYGCSAKDVTIKTNKSSFPGDITLSAEGTYGEATQKIAVSMPKQDVLSGLFSYVVFSECTLYKGPTSGAPGC